jgi:hypothetical protein
MIKVIRINANRIIALVQGLKLSNLSINAFASYPMSVDILPFFLELRITAIRTTQPQPTPAIWLRDARVYDTLH